MTRVSCPVSDSKVASVLCDPLEKGECPCWYLAKEMALKRRIREVPDWLHLAAGSAQQTGRVKASVRLACVMQIAQLCLKVDNVDWKLTAGWEKLGWSYST